MLTLSPLRVFPPSSSADWAVVSMHNFMWAQVSLYTGTAPDSPELEQEAQGILGQESWGMWV